MPEMIEKLAESRIAQLDQRENNLKQDPAESQRDRTKLAVAVDETARARYERLFKSKGENVVVDAHHGVCGGWHMRLPPKSPCNANPSRNWQITPTAAGFCITPAIWRRPITELSTNTPARPSQIRTRSLSAHVRRHCDPMLELVTVGSAAMREIHLTVRSRAGEAVMALARRAAAELNTRQAVAVRVLAFGSLAARDATLAALRLWLNDNVPVTWVEGASCDGHTLAGLQIQAVTGMKVRPTATERSALHASRSPTAKRAGAFTMTRVWKAGHATHCVLSGLAPAHANASSAEQAAQLFCAMQTGLAEAGMNMKHVARTWFYLDDILSWYDEFNRVRNDFFGRQGISAANMPASTGVCGRNPATAALTAAVWAVRPDDPAADLVRTVASPRQCPAPDYGSAFSRAVEITSDGFRQLLISGTASIGPDGRTRHVGDVSAQIDRTMEVVECILASRKMSLADTFRAIAYFKSAKDVAVFSKWLKRRGVKRLPLLNVCCDICRPDLLFELELDALQAGDRR